MSWSGRVVLILPILILDLQKIPIHVSYIYLIYSLIEYLFYKDCCLPGFSTVSDSQGPTDFSTHLGFSEDSNSQNSEPTSKRLKTD